MADEFGKGTRVHIIDGDHQGVVGEIFWLGESKYGPELRAGVTADEDEEQVWVMASEMRAIDEDGEELDPQPRLPLTAKAPEKNLTIRAIEVPLELGRFITAIRLERGYPPSKAPRVKVRMDYLERAEAALGCQIPDPVVAYIASGVGETAKEIGAVIGLTEELLSSQDRKGTVRSSSSIAFDYDNGNFLAFRRASERSDSDFQLLDHEEAWLDGPFGQLDERLARLAGEVADALEPFEVVVDYVSRDEEPEPTRDEMWVSHKKFGRGRVTDIEPSSKGDKLTIEFEDGETRKLLARFVSVG